MSNLTEVNKFLPHFTLESVPNTFWCYLVVGHTPVIALYSHESDTMILPFILQYHS